jgi:Rho-binding antiterminator
MAGPKPIACELYDYIEIACMRGYEVRIVLDDYSEITGKARTTKTSAKKVEYLVVDVNDLAVDVPTHKIASMTALTAGASFTQITFK